MSSWIEKKTEIRREIERQMSGKEQKTGTIKRLCSAAFDNLLETISYSGKYQFRAIYQPQPKSPLYPPVNSGFRKNKALHGEIQWIKS